MFPLTTDTDNNVARITVQCAYTIYNIYMYIHTKALVCLQTDIFFSLTYSHSFSLVLSLSLSLSLSFCVSKSGLSFEILHFSFILLYFLFLFLFVFLSFNIPSIINSFFFLFYLNKIKLAVTISG